MILPLVALLQAMKVARLSAADTRCHPSWLQRCRGDARRIAASACRIIQAPPPIAALAHANHARGRMRPGQRPPNRNQGPKTRAPPRPCSMET
jgi:hypothetical protein